MPLLVVLCAVLFYVLLLTPMSGVLKFVLAIILLSGTGMALQKEYKLEGWYGMNLLRDKRGLDTMDKISRIHPELWNFLADIGLVLGFGAFAKLLFRHVSWKALLTGLLFMLFLALFIFPLVLPVAISVITFPDSLSSSVSRVSSSASEQTSVVSLLQTAIIALLLLGGFVLAGVLSLVLNAAFILLNIVKSILGESAALASTSPGASFIIPGINLPLFEGVLALAILLIVHEGAHGVLARVGKIKLISAGLVFFGIIPAGAFVDPDEKKLDKVSDEKQSRVLVAGSTANFFTSVVFFFVLLLFMFAYSPFTMLQVVAANSSQTNITVGSQVLSINGVPTPDIDAFLASKANLSNGSLLTVQTDKGTFTQPIDSENRFGVLVSMRPKPGFGWMDFFYNIFALAFVLNFLIGSVNLLPVPMFDGYRLVLIGLRNKRAADFLALLVALCFAINFLPWLWH